MSIDAPSMHDAQIDLVSVMAALAWRLPRIILVTVVVLAATFAVLTFMPRLYESSASILVEPRSNVYARAANEQAPSAGTETGVVSSQIELVKSRDTLLQVIDELDLRANPEFNGTDASFSPLARLTRLMGRGTMPVGIDETVLKTLYERMTVVQERDSRIITVLVRATDPQLAADIANAVANAHVTRRAQLSLSDTAEASDWLSEEIARLRVAVKETESAVAQFKVDNDLFVGSDNTSLLDQQLSDIATQITSAQERKNTALSRAKLIRGLIERDQPIAGVPDVRESVIVQELSQEKAGLQGEMAQRSATLLSNHPNIRALAAQIAELDRQITIEGRRVADALEAEAQVEADLEASLLADLERFKQSASTATRDTVALEGLQREAKAQRDLLEAYLSRYNEAASRADPNSVFPDVRVISEAAPSVIPASPKSTLILAGVGAVVFIVQVGGAIFGELISGRALRPLPSAAAAPVSIPPMSAPPVSAPPMPTPPVPHSAPPSTADASVRDRTVEERRDRAANTDAAKMAQAVAEARAAQAPLPPEPEPAPEPEFAADLEMENEPVDSQVLMQELAARRARMNQAEDAHAPRPESGDVVHYADLVDELVLGRAHLLLLADHGSDQPSEHLGRSLAKDALAKGLSVAFVDAGSGRVGTVPGLSDLSRGTAGFGDIVRKSADRNYAEIAWGQGDSIDRASDRLPLLIAALGDIYEVVIVLTGRVGRQSNLPLFVELEARVVLVTNTLDDTERADVIRRRLVEAGLAHVEIAALTDLAAA